VRPKKRHRRVEVTWRDSYHARAGWLTVDEALDQRDTCVVHSVGFVLADDRRGVLLAGSVHGENAGAVTFVPRAQVVKTRRLR
jgi:hypothetical protein